jgi:dsRNA-specific ribonuclease
MTHTSFKNNCLTESYNEQEWIGDRVLGKLISYNILILKNKKKHYY